LILQLGYILHTVPAWKSVYKLRILVFVEYETEVAEERARLKSLLDKLRIDAEVQVSWLASGALGTYEYILNGKTDGGENSRVVNELLKGDEWWEELQRIRREASRVSRAQELSFGRILEASRRRGSFPATEGSDTLRRLSVHDTKDRLQRTTVTKISKLGASFGIRTHHLGANIVNQDTDRAQYESSDEESTSSSSSDADFNDAASEGDIDELPTARQPLLFSARRNSHGDDRRRPRMRGRHSRDHSRVGRGRGDTPSYGAMGSIWDKLSPFVPHESQSSDSGRVVPNTSVESSKSGDADLKVLSASRRPLSRNTSVGRFSSRPVPETRMHSEQGAERLTFVEPEPSRTPFIHSRRNSGSEDATTAFRLDVPQLLNSLQVGTGTANPESQSDYSTQSMALSFNDLPSRAQHLILNELMRQNSGDTAVMLTTLPIPEEGTCKSEQASLKYLSDIEVFCHELPPTLLVLSNNMTVTVNL
jgi:solute carrier family 12 (potassium/chloride transporters), member 9